MAWQWPGDKQWSEPIIVNLLTHRCITRPQWVEHNIDCNDMINDPSLRTKCSALPLKINAFEQHVSLFKQLPYTQDAHYICSGLFGVVKNMLITWMNFAKQLHKYSQCCRTSIMSLGSMSSGSWGSCSRTSLLIPSPTYVNCSPHHSYIRSIITCYYTWQ